MLRLSKRLAWILVLAAGVRGAFAFSLGGPFNEAWQVQVIGFNVPIRGDIMAPRNIGEEYRRNTPVMYYSFDQSFLDFFGSNGVYAVEQAFKVFNDIARTNLSDYPADLSNFPLESRRVNYRAGALNLMDLKSSALSVMVEQLGLAEPMRYTWNIHDRFIGPGGCPADVTYLVSKRNFAIVPSALDQVQYSSYVNGILYSYYILEYCASPPAPAGEPLAEAVEISTDPLALTSGAVAEYGIATADLGAFYTGLTRDDVAGLRYLIRNGNVNWETADTNSLLYFTNNALSGQQLVITSNLTLLAEQSLTNDDAGLVALYPNLVIGSTVPAFTNTVTTNIIAYYTNEPWAPAGNAAVLVYATNYDTNVSIVYYRSFANVVTNEFFIGGYISVLDSNVVYAPWGQPGQLVTNITTTPLFVQDLVVGDFFIFPTNACGAQIVRTQLVKVLTFTNTPAALTNLPTVTNSISGSNAQTFSRSYVYYFTNHQFVVNPILCISNSTGLLRGIEHMTFVRRDYDSLLGQFFYPQTNFYNMVMVTNSTNWVQTYQRVITQPDFLFEARDFIPGPAAQPIYFDIFRSINFNAGNALAGLAGPGTITSPSVVQFNKNGPVFENFTPGNLAERLGLQLGYWGSFDETTNAPVVYPNGTSIESLENMILMQFSILATTNSAAPTNWVVSASLPDGRVSAPYPAPPYTAVQFSGSGGSPPYTWSLAPTSAAWPAGLTNSANRIVGTIGANVPAGVYDITVRMTDSAGRYVDRDLSMTVAP